MQKLRDDRSWLWWVSPTRFLMFVVLPLAFIVGLYSPTYVTVDAHYYQGFMLAVFVFAMLAFVIGAQFVGLWTGNDATGAPAQHVDSRALDAVAIITMVAYLAWFYKIILNPGIAINVFTGASDNVRDDVTTIPGITTMVSMGITYSASYATNFVTLGKLPKRQHVFFVILLGLALLRAILWSERLALMEYILPAGITFACAAWQSKSRLCKLIKLPLFIMPYMAIAFSFFFFAFAEYFRSWNFYKDLGYDFKTFMFDRWVMYYLTSLNNGASLVQNYIDEIPNFKFYYTLTWFFKIPVLGEWLATLLNVDTGLTDRLLNEQLNPEFTVFTGVYPLIFDFGIPGGFIAFFVFGLIFGYMYKGFVTSRGIGRILYPTMFVEMLEITRISYMFDQRYKYVVLSCVVLSRFFMKSGQPDEARRENAIMAAKDQRGREAPVALGTSGRVGA